jgi:hypothetical protein
VLGSIGSSTRARAFFQTSNEHLCEALDALFKSRLIRRAMFEPSSPKAQCFSSGPGGDTSGFEVNVCLLSGGG